MLVVLLKQQILVPGEQLFLKKIKIRKKRVQDKHLGLGLLMVQEVALKEAGVLEQVEPLALAIEVTKEGVGEDT